jgi:hypothetical protein
MYTVLTSPSLSAFAEASWDRIQAAALFLLWIFVWDDEIDHGEGQNDISTCSEMANAYCQESLDYIRWTLGLCGNDAKEPMCNIQTMPIFRDVARAMVEKMDLGESTSTAVFHTAPL